MSVLELHKSIITRVLDIQDESFLKRFLAFISVNSEKEAEKDWWDELSAEQQNELLEIQARMRRGEGVVSNEEVMRKMERWA